MKQIAILHLLNNFGDSSITRIVRDLVIHLGSGDFTWHVGGLDGVGDQQDTFDRHGAGVAVFGNAGADFTETRRRVREYVEENRIDIVHSHTPRSLLTLRMALGGRHRQRHVATKHILNSPGDRRWGLLYSLVDRLLLYAPDHLVAVSGKVMRGITACPGIRTGRISLIRNAVDNTHCHMPEQRDACRAELGLTPGQVLIGTTGRLEKVKRYDLLLRGFSKVHEAFPRSRLMIAGDGTLRNALEELARGLGIRDSVIWTGFRKDIPRLLAAMDVYIMSSVNEGLSLSILEAMAAGKPVVITDVGGARELVEDGKTGLLIPPGSAEAIARGVTALLGDPVRMSELARAGREYVVREYSLERMMESYGRLYRALAARLP